VALAITVVAALTAGRPPRRRCLAAGVPPTTGQAGDHDQPSELQAMTLAVVSACSDWAPVWHMAAAWPVSADPAPPSCQSRLQKIPPGMSTFG
jgi:hypothetical protein